MTELNIQTIIFLFFFISCAGWVLETVQESIVRRKFVNKGFFKGPYIPSHGIGGICVYIICSPFKAYPLLVFALGAVVCTAVEYIMALFLEKCFNVKCWDYSTYPHTKFCHYKGRICLTLSAAFGFLALFIVYFYWNIGLFLIYMLKNYIWLVDGLLVCTFFVDVIIHVAKVLKAKKAGIKIKSWAIFTDVQEIE